MISDDDLRRLWREAGGSFHGPVAETGTMPEVKLLPFLRSLSHPTITDAMIEAAWFAYRDSEYAGLIGMRKALRAALGAKL